MSIRSLLAAAAFAAAVVVPAHALTPEAILAPEAQITSFGTNPIFDGNVSKIGGAYARLAWQLDDPIYPGDTPGSLSVLYRSDMETGLVGWALPEEFDQDDHFVAAAIFVLDRKHFHADPFGFFQISWGLWNSETMGLDRTGSFENPAGNTFELLEYDYFPNVSPYFGGPWISPTLFGVADEDHPLFELLGSFANLSFGSSMYELPRGLPLLAMMDHDPDEGVVIFTLWEITRCGKLQLHEKATTHLPLSLMSDKAYSFDRVGLTLWRDGWGGPKPAVDALVHFHRLIVRKGRLIAPIPDQAATVGLSRR